MLNEDGENPVHIPSDPKAFQFDGEVSRIFGNMAERSIPNFRLAHQVHVSMAGSLLAEEGCKVLDAGASRGHFIHEILSAGHSPSITALDYSEPMCEYLKQDFPGVDVRCMDLSGPEFNGFLAENEGEFSVVCCNYVLQFLPPASQVSALTNLSRLVRPGGMLFIGHKAEIANTPLAALTNREYIKFRLRNGYTQEEIDAKTAALAGTMHPMNHAYVMQFLRDRFQHVEETTRFMMFRTIAAVR